MSPFNFRFQEALTDYVLHDKEGETHTYMGQPLCNSRPCADIAYDPMINGERPQPVPSYMR